MSDRELLEAAAKAADISLDLTIRPDGLPLFCSDRGLAIDNVPGWWGPLTDDGDALRLAVKLNIDAGKPGMRLSIDWQAGADPYAATRRAIVRAAAAMGAA